MREALQSLLHLKDPPHRTALAFATGVFIAFSPLLGLHTVMAIAIAFAFRLNRVAVIAGAWINAWALAPCYAFGTLLGALLLGVDARRLDTIDWDQADASVWSALASVLSGDWHHALAAFGSTLRALFWPIVVGNTLLGSIAGLLAYALARRFLESRAKRSNGPRSGPGPFLASPPDAPKV